MWQGYRTNSESRIPPYADIGIDVDVDSVSQLSAAVSGIDVGVDSVSQFSAASGIDFDAGIDFDVDVDFVVMNLFLCCFGLSSEWWANPGGGSGLWLEEFCKAWR